MKKTLSLLFVLIFVSGLIIGCATLKDFLSGSTTHLTSRSLATAAALRAAGVTVAGTREGSNWLITPTKISGKILSVVLPVNGREDEGIVPFGDGRPDIAPANSTLYDFDLTQVTRLRKDSIGLKPGYTGGQATQIIMLFGYFDVEFTHNGQSRKIRFVYGDTGNYVRGDKLLLNANSATDNKNYWYNTANGLFVSESSTRPSSPEVNTYVRDFSDPIRPEMHYYLLGANLRNNTDYDGLAKNYITLTRRVVEDNQLAFTVDFDVRNAVLFANVSSEAAFNSLTDAQLIQKFNMKQNTSRWDTSELDCHISFEATPKY
ncbi:hypothetical protein HZB07_04585 [Candidatus Saganbacteria bacterium]|nr:hypothetical protein [Candidatus Saganbacteria bacterium]